MKFLVTHTIEAENKASAVIYLKQSYKNSKVHDIQELPIYIQNYKSFVMTDKKFEQIVNHLQVIEINMTNNIFVVKMIGDYEIKDNKNIKIFRDKVIFNDISLSYFIDFMYKNLII